MSGEETSTNVVSMLTGSAVPAAGEPVTDVVDLLEELLVMARSGDLRGLSVAANYQDGVNGWAWRMDPQIQKGRVVGGITMLQHEFIEKG